MKIPSSNLGRTCCVQKSFLTFRTIFVHNMFSLYSAKRRASDKDLPVRKIQIKIQIFLPPLSAKNNHFSNKFICLMQDLCRVVLPFFHHLTRFFFTISTGRPIWCNLVLRNNNDLSLLVIFVLF